MTESAQSVPARFWAALSAIIAGAVALGIAADVALNRLGLTLFCPFHELTSLYCPGCGSTRAIKDLLRGDIASALSHNLLLIVSRPVMLYLLVADVYGKTTGKRFPTLMGAKGWGIVFLAFALVFTILRNLHLEPFKWLAP